MSQVSPTANTKMIKDILPLEGRLVLDVGCGDGGMVRLMTSAGAQVIGLDNNPVQLTKARTTTPVGDETYMEGVGEDLPLVKKTVDIVLFFNSLHHIPVSSQKRALAEAHRVLKPEGLLAVFEPVATGDHFELNKPVDDETFVRAAALRALRSVSEIGLREIREISYEQLVIYRDFSVFKERCLRIAPERKAAFDNAERDMLKLFEAKAHRVSEGYGFIQPMRINLLEKN